MKLLAAYLLLTLGGNASPSAKDITAVLSSVGIEADATRVEKLISELKGKTVSELIAEGSAKLASVPTGGASSGAAGGASGSSAAAAAVVEEEPEKEEEESDEDMGFGLFD